MYANVCRTLSPACPIGYNSPMMTLPTGITLRPFVLKTRSKYAPLILTAWHPTGAPSTLLKIPTWKISP